MLQWCSGYTEIVSVSVPVSGRVFLLIRITNICLVLLWSQSSWSSRSDIDPEQFCSPAINTPEWWCNSALHNKNVQSERTHSFCTQDAESGKEPNFSRWAFSIVFSGHSNSRCAWQYEQYEQKTRSGFIDVSEKVIAELSKPVKILISSRRDIDIKHCFEGGPNLEIRAIDNQDDIASFVKHEVTASEKFWQDDMSFELQDLICNTLVERIRVI